jgi:GntR family transcriptional repressor for pyruvate dehydrogenase complex
VTDNRVDRADQGARDWRGPVLDARSKAERVADALQERIRAEGLAPGNFLGTKAMLREQLRISPATLDTALGVLTDRGMIEVRPGVKGGVRVAAPTSALWRGGSRWPVRGTTADPVRAGQAMALYLALQSHIVARAVGALTPADHGQLENARTRLTESIGDPEAYHQAHLAAHHALLAACHDEVLIAVVRLLMSTLDDGTGPARPPDGDDAAAYTKERVAVHVGIIDAVLGEDLSGAWRWLLQHGLTPQDVRADVSALPTGAAALQEQWRGSFGEPVWSGSTGGPIDRRGS